MRGRVPRAGHASCVQAPAAQPPAQPTDSSPARAACESPRSQSLAGPRSQAGRGLTCAVGAAAVGAVATSRARRALVSAVLMARSSSISSLCSRARIACPPPPAAKSVHAFPRPVGRRILRPSPHLFLRPLPRRVFNRVTVRVPFFAYYCAAFHSTRLSRTSLAQKPDLIVFLRLHPRLARLDEHPPLRSLAAPRLRLVTCKSSSIFYSASLFFQIDSVLPSNIRQILPDM